MQRADLQRQPANTDEIAQFDAVQPTRKSCAKLFEIRSI
jgi:hypothetical protein